MHSQTLIKLLPFLAALTSAAPVNTKRQDVSQYCTVVPQAADVPATIDCSVPNLTATDIDTIFATLDPTHCTRTAYGIDCSLLSATKAKRNEDFVALPIVIGSVSGADPALLRRQISATTLTVPKDLLLDSGVAGTLAGGAGPVSAPEVGPVKYEYGGFKLRPTDDILEQVGQPLVLNGGGLTVPVVKPVLQGP